MFLYAFGWLAFFNLGWWLGFRFNQMLFIAGLGLATWYLSTPMQIELI